MWSVGDRYHDWWPAERGDIGAFKKCGDFAFLADIIHYCMVYESIKAFNEKKASLGNLGTDFNDLNHC